MNTFFTFLSRNKAYTAITVFGFAVSLTFILLILLYARQEFSVDKMHSKADRIYLLATETADSRFSGSTHTFIPKLQGRYPDIEMMCGCYAQQGVGLTTRDGEVVRTIFMMTDSTFFRMFDVPLLKGDRDRILLADDEMVVSEKLARTLFGDTDPVGQTLATTDGLNGKVTGVFRSLEGTSFKDCDVLASWEFMRSFNFNAYNENNYGSADVFLLAKPGADLRDKEADLTDYFRTFSIPFQYAEWGLKSRLLPLSESYFSDYMSNCCRRGNYRLVSVLFASALVILLFAVLNYVNLTVAQSPKRSREMATRRLFGAQRKDVALRLVGESVSLCALALLIALLLAWAALPWFNALLDTELQLAALASPLSVLVLLGFVAVIGGAAGAVPALLISRAKPIEVVRGTFRHVTKMRLSGATIALQNAFTIIFLSLSLLMIMQIRHWVNAPMGYDHDKIMEVCNPKQETIDEWHTFLNEVKKLPCVQMVAQGFCSPLSGGFNNTVKFNGKPLSNQHFYGDKNYLKMFGLQVETDYHVASTERFYLTRASLAAMGLDPNARQFRQHGDQEGDWNPKVPIAGILKAFRIATVTQEEFSQRPTIVHITPDPIFPDGGFNFYATRRAYLKVTGSELDAFSQVSDLYRHIFHEELDTDHPYIDQQIERKYQEETRLSLVATVFAAITVLISLLGLIALSTYYIDQHRREIAVRKVMGASSREVRRRFVLHFLRYVAVAVVVALPLGWWLTSEWQADYSHTISPLPALFAAALFALLLSALTVWLQCMGAANENPVNHIKDE